MRNALVTVAIGDSSLWQFTHPLMKRYAEKHGIDFIKITGDYENSVRSRLKKFDIYELLAEYDRVIYMDGDIAINPACPDLFAMVPYGKIGAVFERPPYAQHRGGVLKSACEFYGVHYPYLKDEDCSWFNTGLLVLSRCHRNLFIRPEQVKIFGEGWIDMPLMNTLRIKNGYEIHDLGLQYNYMGSLVSHNKRPFEPIEAYLFHATGFLRHYRRKYVELVVKFWTQKSLINNVRAYQIHPTVLSYKIYEAFRKKAAGMRRKLKAVPAAEERVFAQPMAKAA